MSTWDVSINGTMLNTQGSGVSGLAGLGAIAGRDFYNAEQYAFDGESSMIGGLAAGAPSVTVWVDDCDRTTGVRPKTLELRQAQVWANLRWLTGLFVTDYLIALGITLPSLNTALTLGQRTIVGSTQLVAMSDPKWNDLRTKAEVTLSFKVPSVYFRPPGGDGLDADGYKTVSMTGPGQITLPTDVYPMNGFIEDPIITVTAGTNKLSTVKFVAGNQGAPTGAAPQMTIQSLRSTGLLGLQGKLVADCRKHTVQITTNGSNFENGFKLADWSGGRPGSMLRIGPPYRVTASFTPTTAGQVVTDVVWSVKYRPSFI